MRFAENAGVRIAFESEGCGQPLVLLHGFSQSRQAWRAAGFVSSFVAQGRQVILIDLRGHGDSDKPHDASSYAMDLRVADVIAVLDALSLESADILGYSMGGAIAMATVLRHPERCRAVTVGGAHPYGQSMAFYHEAVRSGLDHWLDIIERHVGALPEDTRAMFLSNDVDALRAAVADDRADLSRDLVGVGRPLLLYAGSDDPVHDAARRFADASGHRFLSLPGLNHMQAFFAVSEVVATVQDGPGVVPGRSREFAAVV